MTAQIDTFVLPGMQTVTIPDGIRRIERISNDMRESEDLFGPLSTRLRFLKTALPRVHANIEPGEYPKLVARFAEIVVLAIHMLKKYSAKKGLQRVAASRRVRDAVRHLHSKIDAVFIDAKLGSAPEMNDWRDDEEDAIDAQHARLTETVSNPNTLTNGLTYEQLHEAATEIKFELTRRSNPDNFTELLQRALDAVSPVHIPPNWFVIRDEVEIGEEKEVGSFGTVHHAKLGDAETDVCVKVLLVEGKDAQRHLFNEANAWFALSHPNIVPMLGACHVGTPLFIVSEFAKNGNLVDFLQRTPTNKHDIWQLILDAAQGLSYLHDEDIVHGSLRCNNILVGDDRKAKLIDFGFSYTRTLSIGRSLNAQAMAARWKAPECLLKITEKETQPTFASDIYSFGMSIIEAMTRKKPWDAVELDENVSNEVEACQAKGDPRDEMVSNEVEACQEEGDPRDDMVSSKVEACQAKAYPRPDDVFSDDEWALVLGMTKFKANDRMSLAEVIEKLRQLAHYCEVCKISNPANSKFCNECGGHLPESTSK